MTRNLLAIGIVAVSVSPALNVGAFTREAAPFGEGPPGHGLSQDCTLLGYNACSGWVWVHTEGEGAVWGVVFDPDDCPGGCLGGGTVCDIWFWSECLPNEPATVNDVSVELVDAAGCPTSTLWSNGPLTVYSCVSTNHWTHLVIPAEERPELGGNPFAILIEWGPTSPARVKLGTDSGVANLRCWLGHMNTFPGCMDAQHTCAGWGPVPPPQVSYIYASDFNGDTVVDDLCSLYGNPYTLEFPYVAPYGYMPNNLLVVAGLDCQLPASVATGARGRHSSWGRVKALYE